MLTPQGGLHLASPIDPIVGIEHFEQLGLDGVVGEPAGAHRARHR